jgi:hypothetical protein
MVKWSRLTRGPERTYPGPTFFTFSPFHLFHPSPISPDSHRLEIQLKVKEVGNAMEAIKAGTPHETGAIHLPAAT